MSPVPLQCESIAEEYEDELIEFLSHEAENVKDRLCSKRTGELGGSGGSAAHPGLVAAPSVLEWEEMRFQPRAGAVPGSLRLFRGSLLLSWCWDGRRCWPRAGAVPGSFSCCSGGLSCSISAGMGGGFQPRAGAVPGVSPAPEAEAAPSVLGWEEALARSRGCPWGSLLLSLGVSPAVWGSLLLPWCWDGRRY